MDKQMLKKRIEYRQQALEAMWKAYLALTVEGVKSYQLDDRMLTFYDIDSLKDQIDALEAEVDRMEDALNGVRRIRRVVPMDW